MSEASYPLSTHQREALRAIGRAAVPAGVRVPEVGDASLDRLQDGLGWMEPAVRRGYLALLTLVETAVRVRAGRSLERAEPRQVVRTIERIAGSGRVGRLAMDGLLVPLRVAHVRDPDFFDAVGCPYDLDESADEPARWHAQALDAREVESPDDLECDVVVVGSGAGGATVACRLAEAGYAVLLAEEGDFYRRCHFHGRPVDRLRALYRNLGMLPMHGNTRLVLPVGRTLGGTTTINSGTCYRTPDDVLRRWQRERGLTELSPDELRPYLDRVERVLEIAPCEPDLWGGVADAVIRGCDALGYAHQPVRRNAPECDGQAMCAFGCPTGAKRSADVTYVPLALRSGAFALTGAEVRCVLWRGARACGVEIRDRDGRSLAVRSRAVVVAAGAVHSPAVLSRSFPGKLPRALGRHLTVHPAAMVMAVMDEPVRGWEGVPQSYAIEEFRADGLLFEGGFTPPELTAAAIGLVGHRFTSLMDRLDHLALFGCMIGDTSEGQVHCGTPGEPAMTYWLNRRDTLALNRGLRILCRVFLAAGAREVFPMAGAWPTLRNDADLQALTRSRFGPGEIDLTAFHPMGTCRMGVEPGDSVVGQDHAVHGVEGCYVVDGSVVPSSLGVNPQVTIFALAERAAEGIARRLA